MSRLAGAAMALACAITTLAPTAAANASNSGAVEIVSQQTNLAVAAGTTSASSALALDYDVLRDDFYSYASCESYRTTYVVNYPYVISSYCTRAAQSNGRHWLYVAYDDCPDLARKDA